MEIAAIFVLSDDGRIMRRNSPERDSGPRLHIAGCAAGNVIHIRHDVGRETARAIEVLASNESPLSDPNATPAHLDDYLRLLTHEAPVDRTEMGFIWVFPKRLDYQHSVSLLRSDTPEGDRLIARLSNEGMPSALAALGFRDAGEFRSWSPWCFALVGDEIVSVAETVGVGPATAEVGVTTVPAFRGRGFAAAATAGWATHPAHSGRTLFYGASRTNRSSIRVTERLGLRLVGMNLAIT